MALPGSTTLVHDGSGGVDHVNQALHTYLHDVAEPDRFQNYEMRNWASPALQPGNTGMTIYAPTMSRNDFSVSGGATDRTSNGVLSLRGLGVLDNVAGSSDEGDPTTLSRRALDFGSDTATLDLYEDVFAISKLFAATATLKKYLERAARYLYQGIAKTEEDLIHEALFWDTYGTDAKEPSTNFIAFQADATDGTWGSYSATISNGLLPEAVGRIWKELAERDNPGFAAADGDYAVFLSPTQVYNMLTNVTGGTGLRFEQESMNLTDGFVASRIGRLFGCSLIQTTAIPRFSSSLTYASNDTAFASGNQHEYVIGVAPDAFYCVEHETLQPQLYYEGFETGGVYNPTHNHATLGSSFSSAVIAPSDRVNKLVVIPVEY